MYNIDEVVEAIFIAVAVATLLLNTGRSLKAIELCNEYLIFLNDKGREIKGELAKRVNCGIYYAMFRAYSVNSDYTNAIQYGNQVLAVAPESSEKASVAIEMAEIYRSQNKHTLAKQLYERAIEISINIGDRKAEADGYRRFAAMQHHLGKLNGAKEYLEKALVIRKEIGDRKGEATCYGNLGGVFRSQGKYVKAEGYIEKALAINVEIGDTKGEAICYGNLGTVFECLGEFCKAEENLEKALSLSRDIGDREKDFQWQCKLSLVKLSQRKIEERTRCIIQNIGKSKELQDFLVDNDQFKISFSDLQVISAWFCAAGNIDKALYVVELGRARALADLMAAQYSAEKQMPSDMQSWVGIETIMKKESNCNCVYITYDHKNILLWILTTSGVITFRSINVNEADFVHVELDTFFAKSFRSFSISPEDECEDRSLNGIQSKSKSSQQEIVSALRLFEDEEQIQDPETLFYKMIIAPVVDLLEEPEIIIVPDRSLHQVPFAALIDENKKFLSETFRIRIVPSLTTLKLIQDSPADYHSQTGALIVGNPKVGRVFYQGRITNVEPLPCAEKEAEMIGGLLGVQPLLGEQATKQAVLQNINSVSLIHFAAHGDAERGEIALTPLRTTHRTPQEEDYLLTMSDISQVQLRAKLVVLSCCHSGRGQIRAEGAVGIARAFLGSGARSVLVALWALKDSATEQFMSRFYEHLFLGESASESLDEAMKWMRAYGYPKVCDWAPFMLIGDNVSIEFGKERKEDPINGGLESDVKQTIT